MNLLALRPKTQVLLAVVIPIVCLAVGAMLLWPVVSHMRAARRQLEETQKTIAQKKLAIAQAEGAAGGRSLALAVALPTEEEPIEFLKKFAALTVESGVTLVSVRATTPPTNIGAGTTAQTSAPTAPAPPAASPGGAIGQGQRPVVPPTVKELTDEATVEGKFGDILGLIIRLENFERILSVSQCRVDSSGRSYPTLRAVFRLSRFVAAPQAPPTAAASPTTAQ
jgi:hypothetical protein